MKTIILCGGYGTRMKEETEFKPKPLVHVGNKPILWHIMKIYAHYGHRDFVLALGYKGEMIKEYFLKAHHILNDFTLDGRTRDVELHGEVLDDFQITFAETGLKSNTGERILRLKKYLQDDEEFMVTYGDGVADIDINSLIDFHRAQGTVGTVSGVHPRSKYGLIKAGPDGKVLGFNQKPMMKEFISGGFMVFNKKAMDYFNSDDMETGLVKMAEAGELSVYNHEGFWKAMDTVKEVQEMNEVWDNTRDWAVWNKNE